MSDGGDGAEAGGRAPKEAQIRQMRLLAAGTVAGGLLVAALGATSPDSYWLLVVLLGFLGLSALVLEWTQGSAVGVSLGFLTDGIVVFGWPYLGGETTGFALLGGMLVVVGVLNAGAAPLTLRLRDYGERFARGQKEEE